MRKPQTTEWARLMESSSVHCTIWPASPFDKVLGLRWAPAQCKHGQRFHRGNSYTVVLDESCECRYRCSLGSGHIKCDPAWLVSPFLISTSEMWSTNQHLSPLSLSLLHWESLTDFVVSTEAIERNKSGSKQSHRPELSFLRHSHIGLLSLNLATVMIGRTLWRPWYYDSQITTAQGQNVAHWLKQKKGTFLTWQTCHNFACLFIILSIYHSTTGKDYVLVLLSHLPSHVKCQVPFI